MSQAMRHVLLSGHGLLFWGQASVFFTLLSIGGCELSAGMDSGESSSGDESTSHSLCEPSCDGAGCGDDDCGGRCQCKNGFECDLQGNCVEAAACTPACDGTRCEDGCGGSCSCSPARVCNAERACVLAADCLDDCEAAHYSCGPLCGVDCGTCGPEEFCFFGKCKSQRSSLNLQLENARTAAGRTEVRLGLAFDPADGQILPRMADLQLALEGASDLQIEAVAVGQALEMANKDLFTDELTGKPWQVLPDGTVQFLVYSSKNASEIGAGVWLTIVASFRSSKDATLRLVRKGDLFAPSTADSALQDNAYDLPVTVMP